MKWNPYSRRMFLQGAGKFAMAIPLLPSLMPRELWGATVSPRLRYLTVSSELGYSYHSDWYPTLAQPSNVGNMPGEKPFYYQALRSYAPNADSIFSPIFKNHLNKYWNDINIYRGLDAMTRYAHGPGVAFGNMADNTKINPYLDALPDVRTLDQVLNDSRKFNPAGLDSIVVGFIQNMPSYKKSVTGKVVKNSMSGTPTQVFNQLVAGVTPIQGGGTEPTAPTDPMVDVLGRVLEDFNDTRRSRNISSADKIALETTADRLNDLQKRLNGETTSKPLAQCTKSGIDSLKNTKLYEGKANISDFAKLFRSYVDVMVMAMCCDSSRVAMFINGLGPRGDYMASWAGLSGGVNFHDGISHRGTSKIQGSNKPVREVMSAYNEMMITQILVPLLDQMSAIIEPSNGKSMLYNSLIHVTQESSLSHHPYCMPLMLVGQAGGALKTGYLIDYMDRTKPVHRNFDGPWNTNPSSPEFISAWPGLPVNRAFATILQALGLTPADYYAPVSKDGLGTVNGYGYLNAATYPNANYDPHDKTWNLEQEAKYNLQLSGVPLPQPKVAA
jgi:hypothetical protein